MVAWYTLIQINFSFFIKVIGIVGNCQLIAIIFKLTIYVWYFMQKCLYLYFILMRIKLNFQINYDNYSYSFYRKLLIE